MERHLNPKVSMRNISNGLSHFVLCGLTAFTLSGCGSSGSDVIDNIFGDASGDVPVLSAIQAQIVSQTDALSVDVNNVKKGTPGDDNNMTYACAFDTTQDGVVESGSSCDSLPDSTASFNSSTGVLNWTPNTALGAYEIKVTGTFKTVSSSIVFPISVRLKFNGITNLTGITGTTVTVNWTPNTSAQSYQIYKLNTLTGLYEVFQLVTGGSNSGYSVTGLVPNTGYTFRVQALDILGNPDGNTVSKSFTTTTLTRFDMTPASSTVSAGTAVPITVTAYNADGSPQTIGGLTLTPQIQSGTSSGTFSAVTDNNNGTYSFNFTPTTVGTPIEIEVTMSLTFYLNNTVSLTINPGPASSTTSTLTLSSATVVSGNAVSVTANIRDAYNNPLPSATVSFAATGGTSTGTIAVVSNAGGGVYSSSFTGIVAGSAKTMRVTVNGTQLTNSSSITVLAGPAVSANSSLSISSTSVSSGSSVNLSTTLRDINNNLISSGVLVTFNKSGGTSSGSLSGVVNAGSGVYTSSYTGLTAGSAQTITVSVDGVTLTPTVTITVVPGPASLANSSISISAPTVTSGSFVTVSATLRDANSNAIDSGVTVSFSKSGGTSTGTFNSVTNQGGGVYNVRYTGVVAGTAQTISLLINSVALGATTTVSVTPGAPDAATSTFTTSGATVVSGASVTLTATLRDANSNTIPSGVLVSFTATGGTSTGTISSVTNAGSGQYTATYTGVTSGSSQTINLLTDSSALGVSTTVQVLPGSVNVANSSLVISSPTVVSGSSVTLTATLRDLNNNAIDSGSVVAFTKTGGTSTGTYSAVTNQGGGVYTVTYTGVVAGTAQSANVTINAAAPLSAVSVTVLAGAASSVTSTIGITSGTITAGSTATITATILDANSNPISSGILVTFSKSGGTSTGNFSSVTNMGSGQYAINYQGVVSGSAQTINVLVDSVVLGPTTSVTVNPGAPSALLSTLTVSSSTVIAGLNVLVTATLRDAYSNLIPSGHVVAFDKSGGTSTGSFTPVSNNGDGTYTTYYTGLTAGTAQTLQTNVDLSGFGTTQSVQVLVGAPDAAHSSLSVTSSPLSSGTDATIAAVVRDAYNNPITTQYAITFDTIGGSSTGSFGSVSNGGSGNFSALYTGIISGSAQTVRVLADGNPITGLTSSVQVVPGAVDTSNSTFNISSGTVQSGSAATLSMNLRDVNSNAITSGLTITFSKTSSVSDGTIGSVTNLGSGNYSATYTATTQGAAQTITLIVNGTTYAALNVSVTVTAGSPTQMATSSPSNPVNSIDCVGPYTLTLKDASNNTTYSTSAFTIAFTSAPGGAWSGTLFSDSGCTSGITDLTFNIGVTAQSFYYKSYLPQSITLTSTPSLGSIAAANMTITNSAVLSWIGTGSQFTFSGSGSSTIQDDTTGFTNPIDTAVDGNYMYVVDNTAHRIIKLNISTNQIVGWIGTVGTTEGMTSYDGSGTCAALSSGNFTPIWCVGGRAQQTNTTQVLVSPRAVTFDATYLYVTIAGHRILRFDKTTGAYAGWFGRIATVTTSPAGCVAAGTNVTTPTWCYGGTAAANTADGQFNNPQQIVHYSGYLYVSDYGNNRIQKINVNGTAEGWIGQVGGTAPPAGGQLATCAPLPTTGNPTPGWCVGGVAQQADRYNLSNSPVEVLAPNDGFKLPIGITADSTYLYVGDSNARIQRVDIATGALSGYIGNSPARATPSNNASPAPNATTRYTSTWSTGGVVVASAGATGFHPNIRGLNTDGTYIYIADDYHRISRVNSSDGQGYVQIGRMSSTPTGGQVGCSSTPVGGITPGWCTGGAGNSVNNINGAFFSPYSIGFDSASPTVFYVADYNNFRVQKFNASTGAFQSWLGSSPTTTSTWARSLASGVSASRAGTDDYSIGEVGANSVALTGYNSKMFSTDYAFHRIKKYSSTTGTMQGYVGLIGTYAPTGPAECVGYTSGLTPAWCTGGGRTTSGAGIHGYSSPLGLAADGTYVYIANTGNHRIDRVRITDGLYMGWIGLVGTTPTDGESTCTSTAATNYTPGWCIGGVASNTTSYLSYTSPRALSYNADGNLYILDSHYQITRVTPSTGAITGLAGNASAPVGCTVSGSVANGWCTSTTGPGGTTGYGGTNASNSITSNSTYIYVMDSSTNRINRYNKTSGAPAGFIGYLTGTSNLNTTVTGGSCNGLVAGYPRATPGWCYGTTVGTALNHSAGTTDNAFSGALGIWADDTYIYVADSGNSRVVKINASTGANMGWRGVIATTTGMTDATCIAAGVGGVTPTWCNLGTAKNSRLVGGFDYPTGIWGDTNYVYVYDTRNNRIVTLPK